MPDLTRAAIDRALASFDWDAWERELADRYDAWYRDTLEREGTSTAEDLGGTWSNDDPYITRFADRYIGDRIKQISDTTRTQVADVVRRNLETADASGEGLGITDLGRVIADTFEEFSRSRAQSIARNETAIAVNQGQMFGAVAAGFSYVLVSDGDGDDACQAADGQIWTIDRALANPIEHPNCERSFTPISDEDAEAEGVDEE